MGRFTASASFGQDSGGLLRDVRHAGTSEADNTAEERRRAALIMATAATSADELGEWLDMMGITSEMLAADAPDSTVLPTLVSDLELDMFRKRSVGRRGY